MGTFHPPLYTRERDGEMLSWERRETDPRGEKNRGNGGSGGGGGGARHRPAPSDIPKGAPAPPSSSRGAAAGGSRAPEVGRSARDTSDVVQV